MNGMEIAFLFQQNSYWTGFENTEKANVFAAELHGLTLLLTHPTDLVGL